jgi:hypothetical protein
MIFFFAQSAFTIPNIRRLLVHLMLKFMGGKKNCLFCCFTAMPLHYLTCLVLIEQVPVMDAYGLCRYDWMREALDSFLDLLSSQKVIVNADVTSATTNQDLTPSNDLTSTDRSTMCMIQLPTSTERVIALC